jgi:serine/threonine protein kinase
LESLKFIENKMEHNAAPMLEFKRVEHYFFHPDKGLLGKGAFGKVYVGFDESRNNTKVAIKVIPAEILADPTLEQLILREIGILQQIKGENIVHLLGSCRTANNLYLVLEYCNGGDLETYLRKVGPMSETGALSVLKQITNAFLGFENLVIKNEKGVKVTIMHRDLKPANILFHSGEIRVGDFGFAKMVDDNVKFKKTKQTWIGTPLYMNPQTLREEPHSVKCDVWSAGIMLYQCLFGKLPYEGKTIAELLSNIMVIPLKFSKPINDNTKDLLKKMLQYKEEDRCDWKGVWDHPALAKIQLPKNGVSSSSRKQDSVSYNLSDSTDIQSSNIQFPNGQALYGDFIPESQLRVSSLPPPKGEIKQFPLIIDKHQHVPHFGPPIKNVNPQPVFNASMYESMDVSALPPPKREIQGMVPNQYHHKIQMNDSMDVSALPPPKREIHGVLPKDRSFKGTSPKNGEAKTPLFKAADEDESIDESLAEGKSSFKPIRPSITTNHPTLPKKN